MNKMGKGQRLWCLIVTIVLLLSVAGIYPQSGRKAAEATGVASTDKQVILASGSSLAEKHVTNAGHVAGPEVLSQLKPSSTLPPQQQSSRKAVRRSKPVLPVQPDAIPVSAPAPHQIITSLKVTATGYTAGYESTGKTAKHPQYGITYSGVKVRRDKNTVSTIAADPKVLPLGSVLYIPGYGYAIVADTGSAIKGQKIDLYFATTKQVYKEWGKKTVTVQLIKRGNGKCTEAMLRNFSRAIETYRSVPQSLLEEAI